VDESGVAPSVARIADRLTGLLRDSTDLVRATVREEVQDVMRRVVALAIAGIASFIGLLFLANALALYLSRPLGRPGGFLTVAIVFLLAAGITVLVAGKSGGKNG
jgi:hypothetical protein